MIGRPIGLMIGLMIGRLIGRLIRRLIGRGALVRDPVRPGQWEPSPDLPRNLDEKQLARLRKLADARGQDWGLRNAAHGSVPVTRPIRIDCYGDRLAAKGPSPIAKRSEWTERAARFGGTQQGSRRLRAFQVIGAIGPGVG